MHIRGAICLLGLLLFLAPVHAATGGDFSLTDQHGKLFQLQQLRGKVVLLFFGYTSCPDVCPTELAGISRVLKLLKADAAKVQGVFVSIDPERDNPKVLAEYVHYFDESLIGLTGAPSEIETVAKQYQVSYSKHPNPGGGYAMDHTANLYVIDPNGKLFAIIPYGFPPEHVVDVVKEMLTNLAGKDL